MKRRLARVSPWFLATLALWAGSAGMNASFGWNKGLSHGLASALIFVLMSVSIDVLKGRLPVLMVRAGFVKRLALGFAWVLALSWSLTAALGFLATAQDAERGARTSEAQAYDAAAAEKKRIEAQLSGEQPRSASRIEADIAAILASPGRGSKTVAASIACDKKGTTAYGAISQKWCPQLAVLEAEKAGIATRDKLVARLRDVDAVLASAKPVTIDPTATLIEKVSFGTLASANVQIGLVLLGVVTIEVLSALGFALVAKAPKPKRETVKRPAARKSRKRRKSSHVIRGAYPKLVAVND